jgi:hypothetical protein
MAATTISAILERIETVLSSNPLNLTLAPNPFSDETVASAMVNDTCRVESGGIVHDKPVSNWGVCRLERISVKLQRSLDFEGYQAQRALQDLLDDIERAVLADGPDHDYMAYVEKGSRKITRKKESDVCEAALNFIVDYDFSELA